MTLEQTDADARPASPVLGFHLSMQSPDDGTVEISAAGELDLATSGLLREAVDLCCERDDIRVLILELGDVTFIDSTGLRTLWHSREQARSVGCELLLRTPSAAVSHLLHMTKLDEFFAVVEAY
jgi:anti-sigma B factor antagonist